MRKIRKGGSVIGGGSKESENYDGTSVINMSDISGRTTR
jgi:hypothetical protein